MGKCDYQMKNITWTPIMLFNKLQRKKKKKEIEKYKYDKICDMIKRGDQKKKR